MSRSPERRHAPPQDVPFRVEGLHGLLAESLGFTGDEPDLAAWLGQVLDPGNATETLHWGRNYLFLTQLPTPSGPVAAVVKQFRHDRLKDQTRRRLKGSKAARSWDIARRMLAAGLPTPEPLLLVESEAPDEPAFYICRQLEGAVEARYLLRAAASGEAAEKFPEIDLDRFLDTLGRLARQLHDSGFLHRDLSVGNVLIHPTGPGNDPELHLIDLNRTRVGDGWGTLRRTRDLIRLALHRPEHQERLLTSYWGGAPGAGRLLLYRSLFHSFELKNQVKKPWKALRAKASAWLPRTAHPHIPAAPEGASVRDRAVWDHLSDQPHQHAGRFEKLRVRLIDAPSHLETTGVLLWRAPAILRRYRELRRGLNETPVPFVGAGVALRPWPDDPAALLAAIDDLRPPRALLRLHPWAQDHDAEEELAAALRERGIELAFALPQDRSLVRDPARWRAAIEELAERFVPYGNQFQVGQAINRSKWGVWTMQEFVDLAVTAGEILRRHPGAEMIGPGVIDFEHHAVASVLNLRREGLFFDAVASLLYVDRRGAPENPQMGFDTVDKVVLLRAIAETARNSSERCWITEVNWPLREGPHSPAGKGVAVGEEEQADYLVRYFLLALGTGLVERVYWWQLVAKGYGLIDPRDDGSLRRRPAFAAFRTLLGHLEGTTLDGVETPSQGSFLYRFQGPDGDRKIVAWSLEPGARVTLPEAPSAVIGRDGDALPGPFGPEVEIGPSPRTFLFA